MHHHNTRYPHDTYDRGDVPDEIEIEICVECGATCIRGGNLQKRIAIGGCLYDRLGADIAASARSGFNYELLGKSLRNPLTHQARRDVANPARGICDDPAHWSRRVSLRLCDTRDGRERGSARGQVQKLSAVNFHGDLSTSLAVASASWFASNAFPWSSAKSDYSECGPSLAREKSYSPMPCRTKNTAEKSPAFLTRCGRLGGTE